MFAHGYKKLFSLVNYLYLYYLFFIIYIIFIYIYIINTTHPPEKNPVCATGFTLSVWNVSHYVCLFL